MNITAVSSRTKELFPELFGATMKTPRALHMSADVDRLQMDLSGNTLNPDAVQLWATIPDYYAEKFKKNYADLSLFSHKMDPSINVPPGVQAVLHVEVIESAGAALVDAADWNVSALQNTYAEVKASRISRPFGLNSYDLASGERWAGKREAAIQAVIEGVYAQLAKAIKEKTPATVESTVAPSAGQVGYFVVDSNDFGPEIAAHQLSALFGDAGAPDIALLNASLYSKLIPVNALSFNPETDFAYGIRHIRHSAGMGPMNAKGTGLGVVARQNGIAYAAGLPALGAEYNMAVRYLGEIAGIPMLLKAWVDHGKETLYESVETYAGFSVANPDSVFVLGPAIETTVPSEGE